MTLGKVTDSLVFIGVRAMLRFFTPQGNGLMNESLLGHRSRRVGKALLTFSGGSKALLATGSIDETLHVFTVFRRLA